MTARVTSYESQILQLCRSADRKAFLVARVAKLRSSSEEPLAARGTVSNDQVARVGACGGLW